MITLTLLDSQHQTPLQEWNFEHESTVRIGRSPDNQVVISDSLVSRYHLELRNVERSSQGESWQLLSQGTNGTFVNGKLVSTGVLPPECVIQLAPEGPVLRCQTQSTTATSQSEKPIATKRESDSNSQAKHPCTHAGNPSGNLFCVYCSQPLHIQQTIRDYQVLRVLGSEGMSTTYLVWCLKHSAGPQLQVMKGINTEIALPQAQELFEREARRLLSLHHPRIPRFFDFFIESEKKYLVMELIHAQDLDRRIKQGCVAKTG